MNQSQLESVRAARLQLIDLGDEKTAKLLDWALGEQPAAARAVTLSAHQLREALEFIAPDFDAEWEQREAEVCIAWGDAGTTHDDEGNPDPAGYRVWMAEYPEEGSMPLSSTEDLEATFQASKRERVDLLKAAINCPHKITAEAIVLRFDESKPGRNALNQLGLRLEDAGKES